MLGTQSRAAATAPFYNDEFSVSEKGDVPYGWQFKNEFLHIEVDKGQRPNYSGLLLGRINSVVGVSI
ncbi:hypothetical protein GCM10027577_16710 [Spirosoma fluminis]